ncbi:hypothetical protein BDC45DRAFT_557463 [Circinella umbellata]|nr:hypothetical protein BDC45DRAFT_557463 [Circinella umbellata]
MPGLCTCDIKPALFSSPSPTLSFPPPSGHYHHYSPVDRVLASLTAKGTKKIIVIKQLTVCTTLLLIFDMNAAQAYFFTWFTWVVHPVNYVTPYQTIISSYTSSNILKIFGFKQELHRKTRKLMFMVNSKDNNGNIVHQAY